MRSATIASLISSDADLERPFLDVWGLEGLSRVHALGASRLDTQITTLLSFDEPRELVWELRGLDVGRSSVWLAVPGRYIGQT